MAQTYIGSTLEITRFNHGRGSAEFYLVLPAPDRQIGGILLIDNTFLVYRMRPSPNAAEGDAAVRKAAAFSLIILAVTPFVLGFSYRPPSVLLPLATLPALYLTIRGRLTFLPEGIWGRRFGLLVAVFMLWVAISICWAESTEEASTSALKAFGTLLAGWLCARLILAAAPAMTPGWRRYLVLGTLVPAVGLCLLIWGSTYLWPDIARSGISVGLPFGFERLQSWYNQLSAFLILWGWLGAIVLLPGRRWLAAVIGAAVLAASLVIGYWIGVAAIAAGGLVFLAALRFRRPVAWALAVGLVIGTFAMPVIATHLPSYDEVAATPSTGNASMMHRFMIWQFVSEHIAMKPAFGWGMSGSRDIPGGNERVYLSLDGVYKRLERLPLHPHDTILQIWLELGAVGATLFAAIGAAIYVALGRFGVSDRTGAMLLGCMTSAHVMMGASFSIWSNWWLSALISVAVVAIFVTRPERTATAGDS